MNKNPKSQIPNPKTNSDTTDYCLRTTAYGFSLVEVLVSLGVILATLIIFAVALNTIPLTKNTRNQNIAYHIAAKKMEELRNTEYSNFPESGSFTDPALSDLASSTAVITVSDYQSSEQVKQVQVQIVWEESDGEEDLTLTSLYYEHGVGRK